MKASSLSLTLLLLGAFAGAELAGPRLFAAPSLSRLALPAHSGPTTVTSTGGSVVSLPSGATVELDLDDAGDAAPAFDGRSSREREEVRLALRQGENGTYINELLLDHDSSLARWPDRRRNPLKVWIQPTAGIGDWEEWHPVQVRAAFEKWMETTDIPVRFTFVKDSSRADIHVGFVHSFDEPISGKTVWARDEKWWIVDADLSIAVHYSTGEPLDQSAVFAITLHEVGHLLGLDHCSDPNNIMSPRVRVRELSAADRATAQLLYRLPPGAVR